MRHHPQPVEDFTNPFLVTAGVFLFSVFVVITGLLGLPPVLSLAAFLWLALNLAEARKRRRTGP